MTHRRRLSRAARGAILPLLIFIAGTPALLRAQHEGHAGFQPATTHITGTVLCSDGPPLSGAVVQMVSPNGRITASALTGQDGRFHVMAAPGEYSLHASYIGHETSTGRIRVSGVSFATEPIRLQVAAIEVEALVAGVKKDAVWISGQARSFEVKASARVTGGSVADVLKSVPGVTLNRKGLPEINGAGAALYMDGRKVVLDEAALAALLAQLPADAIRRIETGSLLTASSSGAVINIVTDTPGITENDPLSWRASLSFATPLQGNVALGGTAGLGRNGGASISYSTSRLDPQTSKNTLRETRGSGSVAHFRQDGHAEAEHLLHAANASLSYRLPLGSRVDASAGYSWMRGAYENNTGFFSGPTEASIKEDRRTTSRLVHRIPVLDMGLTWQVEGNSPAKAFLRLAAARTSGMERFSGSFRQMAPGSAPQWFMGTAMSAQHAVNAMNAETGLTVLGTEVLGGARYEMRHLDAAYDVERLDEPLMLDRFRFRENTSRTYLSLSRKMPGFMAELLLAAEDGRLHLEISDSLIPDHSEGAFLPALTIHGPHLGRGGPSWRFSASRSIARPALASLNPYSMGEDDMLATIGNPYLLPSILNVIEASLDVQSSIATVSITPFARRTERPVRSFKTVTASGRATTTLVNIERSDEAGAAAFLSWRPVVGLRTIISGTGFYAREFATSGVAADGIYANGKAQADADVGTGTTLQAYLEMTGKERIEQGDLLSSWTSGLGLTRKIGRAGMLSVRLSDPFRSERLAFRIGDGSFTEWSSERTTTRRLHIAFSLHQDTPREAAKQNGPPERRRIF